MNVTCPNCEKRYNINAAKVPANAKSAKCLQCGHRMPLLNSPSKAPPEDTHIIKITCLNCGRTYRLREKKIPPGGANLKCKSCGQAISLKRDERPAPTSPLKKEKPPVAPEQFPEESIHGPRKDSDTVKFTCGNCKKKYSVRRSKIPANITAVKCKACGQKISIPLAPVTKKPLDEALPEYDKHSELQIMQDRIPEETPPPFRHPRKNNWMFAAAAAIVLVVIAPILLTPMFMKMKKPDQGIPSVAEKAAEKAALLDQEPFAAVNLNVPVIIDAIENRVEKEKKTLKHRMAISILKKMGLKRLELYLYADPENQILPVIVARGRNRKHLEEIFSKKQPFKDYFEARADGTFLLKEDALNEAGKYKFSSQPYEVILFENEAVFAPQSFSGVFNENTNFIQNTQVAAFSKAIGNPQALAVIAIRILENLHNEWQNSIQKYPAIEDNPQAAMIASMGAGIMAELSGSLKAIDTFGLAFRFTGNQTRTLKYAQTFRPDIDSQIIYRQLVSGDLQNTETHGIIKKLIELFQDQRFAHDVQLKENRLTLKFSWAKENDQTFLAALSEATLGQLFARSMTLEPSSGPVEVEYTDEPQLMTTIDVKRLKPIIPEMVKQNLFPGHYWNSGDKPQMSLDLDPVDLPNGELAELSYEVTSIQTPGGQSVLRSDENKSETKLYPGSVFPGSLSLSIKKGTPPDKLSTAKIKFLLSLPVELQVLNFGKGSQTESVKKAGEIQVVLNRLENDVVSVSYEGGKSIRLVAYDQSGRALASKESISSASSISTRFQGAVENLKVVVAKKVLEYPFDVVVDLNGGKELALSRKPEIPTRIRYSNQSIRTYTDFSDTDLSNLTVKWSEGNKYSWTDFLSIQLPRGPFSGYASWEVHFFGKNSPNFLSGNSVQGVKEVSYQLDKGKLKNCHAAFGRVQLNLNSNIKRLNFVKNNSSRPEPQVLSSGDKVIVNFNKNAVTYSSGKANVIQIMAYDTQGKRLKQDNYSHSRGGSRVVYFWGLPQRFEIDVAAQMLTKLIEFDINKRPLDEHAYLAFKQSIENHRDIVRALKSIDRNRRRDRSYYGDDLAGLFYLYDLENKKPKKLIQKEIAVSDPAGKERFGYKVTPYKGYYFSVLAGNEINGAKQNYTRRSDQKKFTWKKGSFSAVPLTRHPDLVATPENTSQPTFFLQWGKVYMKPLNGESLTYLPENYYNQGWVEANFIGS
jgi:predicted Zn finger-like uncharacterized protein